MAEIHFQIDCTIKKQYEIKEKIFKIVEKIPNCDLATGWLSENGFKFKITGSNEALKYIQGELKNNNLPEGIFHSTEALEANKKMNQYLSSLEMES